MENFKRYVYSLILTALVTVIIELLMPNDSATSRQINFICGLCITVALILPVKDGILWLIDAQNKDFSFVSDEASPEDYSDVLSEQISKLSADELKRLVSEKFDIPSDCIDAHMHFNESHSLEKITIILHEKGVFINPHRIMDYLESTFNCPAEVAVS